MSQHYTTFGHLAIEQAKPSPTPEQFAAIEDLLGAPLPSSFREFLQVANGGYLEYVIDVPFGDGESEELCFCAIFSAETGTFCDGTLVGEIRSCRENQQIPLGVLPFARDGGGSMAYLDLSREGSGRVVAFVHGLPEWAGRRSESAFIEVASSFDEYVGKLRIDREAVLDHLTHDANSAEQIDATEEWLGIGMSSWRDDPEVAGAVAEARRRVTGQG